MTVPNLKKLLYVAILAVLGLAARVAMSSTAAFEGVYNPVSSETISFPRSPAARPRPAAYYSSCWKMGGPDNSPTGAAHRNVGATRVLSGRYKLYSTFFVRSPDKRMGYAAIAYDRQERVYAENESVGEYVLAQVFPNSVTLKKGAVSFTLERTSDAGRSAPPSRSRLPGKTSRKEALARRRERTSSLRTARPATATGDMADTQQFTVSEKDRDYITKNFAKILHDVNLRTEIATEDNSMTGIKINNIKPGSILYKVGGLRPGDIIRKVNGKPVNSIHQALSLYESLTKSSVKKVDVQIERKGKLFNRTYSITNQGTN